MIMKQRKDFNINMIIKIILIILGSILFAWFCCPVFVGGILNIGNITGMILSLLILLYGIFFNKFNQFVKSFWHKTSGKIIELVIGVVLLAIICLAICCMVAMGKAMNPGYQNKTCKELTSESFDVKEPSAIVVLGARVKGTTEENAYASLTLANRLDAACKYMQTHPETICIVSGGKGKKEPATESSVMKKYLVRKGIDEEKIIEENKSTDTEENIAFSKKMLKKLLPDDSSSCIAIATNDYHEYRALTMADRQKVAAVSLPAKTPWWLFPTYYVREMYAILELWFILS